MQQTEDLEQKKLVYLYLMNYAKTQPELVILAVNTFVKVSQSIKSALGGSSARQDTADPNPLVRALAIRTMSVLRAEKILDYLASPLSRCLKDENPYVRKTAALCVAKVFDLKPELCIEYGFIETLRDMISDGNPMVSLFRLITLLGMLTTGRRQRRRRFGRHSRSSAEPRSGKLGRQWRKLDSSSLRSTCSGTPRH